jgi:hypothetical protein
MRKVPSAKGGRQTERESARERARERESARERMMMSFICSCRNKKEEPSSIYTLRISSEATTQQNPLLERIFQASWEMHLLFSTVYGFPNRDITRPANSVEYLLLVTSSHPDILFLISVLALKTSRFHISCPCISTVYVAHWDP